MALNYYRSRESAEALAAELGLVPWRCRPTCRTGSRSGHGGVTETFGAPTTVVHNALADFLFNGDARTPLAAMKWEELDLHFTTAVPRRLHLIQETSEAIDHRFSQFIHVEPTCSGTLWFPTMTIRPPRGLSFP